MSLWNDFNDAQSNANVIPKGTLAKVRLTIRPGGFDDASQGWTGGYAKRKIWSMIGLYSPNGPNWANTGRSLIRGILNSSRGLSDKDKSPEAQARRRINGFADLDGLEFVARIDVGTDANGDEKNEIRNAVTIDHKEYAQTMEFSAPMASAPSYAQSQTQPGYAPSTPNYGAPTHQ